MRTLVPDLPRGAWTLLAGEAVSALGSGLTLPFLLVYLHQVRGLGLGVASLALSMIALAAFVGNPAGGSLADRVGARTALVSALFLCAAGSASLAFVTRPWEAFAAATLVGLGGAIAGPARSTLRAALVPAERRSSAYALAHATTNAGLGAGAVLAGLIVDSSSAATFQALYLLDAASFLAFVPILLRLSPPAREHRRTVQATPRGGYREILRDRAFRRLWALTALIVGVSYAQYVSAFPAFATGEAGLDAHQLAFCFAANTIAVVALQLPVLRFLRGRRRTSALAFVFVATGIAWAIVLGGGGGAFPAEPVVVLSIGMIVLAIAETALSTSGAALANDLAPARLRGRYNGVYALAWTGGFACGPALTSLVLAVSSVGILMLGLIGACAVGVLGSLRLAHDLPRGSDVVDGEQPGTTLPEPAAA